MKKKQKLTSPGWAGYENPVEKGFTLGGGGGGEVELGGYRLQAPSSGGEGGEEGGRYLNSSSDILTICPDHKCDALVRILELLLEGGWGEWCIYSGRGCSALLLF